MLIKCKRKKRNNTKKKIEFMIINVKNFQNWIDTKNISQLNQLLSNMSVSHCTWLIKKW